MSTGPHIANARSGSPWAALQDWFADWGAVVVNSMVTVGDMALFAGRTLSWLIARRPRKETLLITFYQIGVLSLPVVALTGTFIGMVLAVQSYYQFHEIGLETPPGRGHQYDARSANLARCWRRRCSPAASAARWRRSWARCESPSKSTPSPHGGEPDSLSRRAAVARLPAADSDAHDHGRLHGRRRRLFVQRLRAAASTRTHYWKNSQEFVGAFDLFSGIFKSLFFGATIAIISCYRGFNCDAGAEGVGRAATAAFVYSFCIILALDLFLGMILDNVYYMIWSEGPSF